MDRRLILIILLLYFVHTTSGDILTAYELSAYLNHFMNDSARFELNQFIKQLQQRTEHIRSMSRDIKELTEGIHGPSLDFHHPLHAFRFIRNQSVVLNDILKELSQEMKLNIEVHTHIEKQLKKVEMLRSEKMTSFIKGFIIVQWTYNLSASEMANGNFGSYETEPFSVEECQDIMVELYRQKKITVAEEWVDACLRKVARRDTKGQTKLMNKAAVAAYSVNHLMNAVKWQSEIVYRNKRNRYYKYRLKLYLRKMVLRRDENYDELVHNELSTAYCNACQGKVERLIGIVKHDLVCDRIDNGHPLLLIQPIKREIISREPFIVVYHDFITTNRMMTLKQMAFPLLEVSKVRTSATTSEEHRQRTSKSCFLSGEFNALDYVNNLIEAVTSLSKKSFEEIQVANYGIGSYYYCHYDFFTASHFNNDYYDNRLATFMLYMSDVMAGGGTVFTSIPDVVFPKMGSALFWYNMHRNITVNEDTMHCACPPVFGDKWVANVWIRRNNNEFAAPCPLDQYKKSWW